MFLTTLGGALAALPLLAKLAPQDHAHHHAAPAAAPMDHSQHAAPPAEAMDHTTMGHEMTGMNHGAPMSSSLGFGPMSRDGSGTSWQPDASHHAGVHSQVGDWMVMSHAMLNLVYDDQSGPRGDTDAFLAGMLMTSARRDFSDGSSLTLRGMVSPDPLMGKAGYPLLLAAGETADGVTTLVDRQHPHDLFMELSATYARPIGPKDAVFAYIGLPGEPAFGPPAFMHRMSAMDSPEAPITHHWLDSTHITFGVVTAGWIHDSLKLETSAFRGREPDEERYDVESPDLDSYAVRASWNPSPEWSVQASWADVTSPEQLEPDEDETRLSASAIYTRRLGEHSWWSSTLAFGRKTNDHEESKDGWLFETAIHSNGPWTVFARAERIETDELVPGDHGGHGDLYVVSKASIGAVHDWRLAEHVTFGVGGLASINRVPSALEPLYGDDPTAGMLFVRLKVE
jgi:hypothetical protein